MKWLRKSEGEEQVHHEEEKRLNKERKRGKNRRMIKKN